MALFIKYPLPFIKQGPGHLDGRRDVPRVSASRALSPRRYTCAAHALHTAPQELLEAMVGRGVGLFRIHA